MIKVYKGIGIGVLIISVIIGFVFFGIPYMIITELIYDYKKKKLDEAYFEFLKTQEGMNFFVFKGSRSVKFIQKHVLPILSLDIKILFLYNVDEEMNFYLRMVGDLKKSNKFLCLIKIRNGEIIEVSLKQELFIWKNERRDKTPFLNKVDSFFEL